MLVYLSWGEGLLRASSNWRHAVAVTLPVVGESNKTKINFKRNSKVPIDSVPRKPLLFKFKVEAFVSRGTQRELLRKKPKNNNKV